jgi:hypothetical protein
MARCPDCGFPTEDPDAPCERCGFQAAVAVGTIPPPVDESARVAPVDAPWSRPRATAFVEGEYYFPFPVSKLILLSLTSLGIYPVYWFYKQWRFIKLSGESDLAIFPRVFFAGLFAHGLFRRVREHAASLGIRTPWSPGALVFGYIAFPLVTYLGGWTAVLAPFNVLALAPVQRTMNEINAASSPPVAPDPHYTIAEILALLPGACIVLVCVASALISS